LKTHTLLIILSLNFLYSNISNAQCRVNTENFDNKETSITYHDYEELYVNTDLENGLLSAYVSAILYNDIETKENPMIILTIDTRVIIPKKMVVPRKLKIYFLNGDMIEISASNLNSKIRGQIYIEMGNFLIENV